MNKIIVTIMALSVDNHNATLYKTDGDTVTIPQGDPRLPLILEASRAALTAGNTAEVDITPIFAKREEFSDAEEGTNGAIKFFRVAKTFLKKLVNTESPNKVKETVAHISPLEIGVFPGQQVEEAIPEPEVVTELPVGTPIADPVKPTNDEKLDAARERMNQIMSVGKPTSDPEFHKKMDDTRETIVAVHQKTGAIIPDAQKLAPQLRAASKLKDFQGFERFVERLSLIIDQRGHSVEDLMKFIERGDLPIADDGCIVIYKRLTRVNGALVDVHSKNIKQKVGSYVFMKAGLVDPNRRQDCSNGLHVASLSYLNSFGGEVTVIAKTRPEDVFAVPQYSTNKMRVCGYHILAELPETLREHVNCGGSISDKPEGAILLNNILRGNHVGITQHVEIGGQKGTQITYTDTTSTQPAVDVNAPTEVINTTLDLVDTNLPELPKAADIKASDLKPAKAKPVKSSTKKTKADEASDLFRAFKAEQSSTVRGVIAQKLLSFKKASKKSWNSLGLTQNVEQLLKDSLVAKVEVVKTETFDAPAPADRMSKTDIAKQHLKAFKSVPDSDEAGKVATATVLWDFARKGKKSLKSLGISESDEKVIKTILGKK